MTSRNFSAIIFDIGRVLIRVDIARAMAGLAAGLTLSPAEVWAAIEKDPLWLDWQEGRVTPRDWHLHLAKRLGTTLSFEEFKTIWNRALDPEPIHPNTFFEPLAKRYRLALLSNTDPIHVAYMESAYEFFQYFPQRVYSCTVKASKPNPLIYKETLQVCKVPASEAIYIDDVLAYVEAARSLGMSAIHFQTPEQLRAELQNLGIQ